MSDYIGNNVGLGPLIDRYSLFSPRTNGVILTVLLSTMGPGPGYLALLDKQGYSCSEERNTSFSHFLARMARMFTPLGPTGLNVNYSHRSEQLFTVILSFFSPNHGAIAG